jgi:CubicO group peptidase (beta-lactamase class C family)
VWPHEGEKEQSGVVAALAREPFAYVSGTGVAYSTAVFEIVKALVVKYGGHSWSSYMREHIFDPLNMNDTGFRLSPEGISRVALAYDKESSSDNWANDPAAQKWEFAGGGLFSTLDDLASFGCSFLSADASLLKPETYEAMTSLQTEGLKDVASGEPVTWGFGWYLNRDGRVGGFGHYMSECAFGHGGATGTRLNVDPENQVVVVFLGNRIGMKVDESNLWETAVTDAAMQDLGLA